MEKNAEFEDEVRRIARELWPAAAYSGSRNVDGRERDGVFETEECIHLVEATVSRRLDKAREDVAKLTSLAVKLQRQTSFKAVRCWFVTRHEPTADQRSVGDKHRAILHILSYAQFQSRLVNGRAYLEAREHYTQYVPLAIATVGLTNICSPDDLVERVLTGQRSVLLGDYGAGKSMTLHYVHQKLADEYRSGRSPRFPIYLNLRDHHGQSEPSEIIERHARHVGFEHPSHLVRAWRAGYVHLLLDGFDEVTTLTIQGLWRKLRDNRFRAMEPVRRLLAQHPAGGGAIIVGRAHFFDTDAERRQALGASDSFVEFSLNEFSDEQVRTYFATRGLAGSVPSWLPSRPLLVAYLVSKGLLDDLVGEWGELLDPARGWDMLLDKISIREADIEAGIDGATVRRILERLATKSRGAADGLASMTAEDIVAGFKEICGYPPDDRGLLLLQRLPGLGIDQGETETRRFVDEAFAETCRAGDLLAFAEAPHDKTLFPAPLDCGAGTLAISVASNKLRDRGSSAAKLAAAVHRAEQDRSPYLVADLAACTVECGLPITSDVYVRDVLIREAEFHAGMCSASGLHYHDCLFGELTLDTDVETSLLPRFHRCFIGILEGRVSRKDLPNGVFEDCAFESFAAGADTTNDVLELQIPLGSRVLLTVLMKLFERRGRGRKENALHRGLDHRARRLVPDVLQLLQAHDIAYPCRKGVETLWIPNRSARARVGRILASPSHREDALVVQASELD
jgi:AraC-like DNA-binding protein